VSESIGASRYCTCCRNRAHPGQVYQRGNDTTSGRCSCSAASNWDSRCRQLLLIVDLTVLCSVLLFPSRLCPYRACRSPIDSSHRKTAAQVGRGNEASSKCGVQATAGGGCHWCRYLQCCGCEAPYDKQKVSASLSSTRIKWWIKTITLPSKAHMLVWSIATSLTGYVPN
jgi:hypothetical protein